MRDVGLDSWQATEKPESYAVEQPQLDGTDSWRTTEKSVTKGGGAALRCCRSSL